MKPEEKSNESTGAYAKAWRQFVQSEANTAAVSELMGQKLAIDHLFAETAAARLGLSHVRVMAVDRRANSLVGSTTERAAANNKPGTLRPRSANYTTLAKISGFQGSAARANGSTAYILALFAHLRALGYPIPAGTLGQEEARQAASSLDWYRGDRQ